MTLYTKYKNCTIHTHYTSFFSLHLCFVFFLFMLFRNNNTFLRSFIQFVKQDTHVDFKSCYILCKSCCKNDQKRSETLKLNFYEKKDTKNFSKALSTVKCSRKIMVQPRKQQHLAKLHAQMYNCIIV